MREMTSGLCAADVEVSPPRGPYPEGQVTSVTEVMENMPPRPCRPDEPFIAQYPSYEILPFLGRTERTGFRT